MYVISEVKPVDRYALLFTFKDGKRVLFDFSKFEREFWFERVAERFLDYEIDVSGIWWGEDGISPIEIYKEGIDLTKIEVVA
jgi:hypothetical protein